MRLGRCISSQWVHIPLGQRSGKKKRRTNKNRYWLQMFQWGYNPKRLKQLILLPRDKLRQLVAIYTCYCGLRFYLRKLGICSTDQCWFCYLVADTPKHIFLGCAAIARRKSQSIGAKNSLREHVKSISPGARLSMWQFYLKKCSY